MSSNIVIKFNVEQSNAVKQIDQMTSSLQKLGNQLSGMDIFTLGKSLSALKTSGVISQESFEKIAKGAISANRSVKELSKTIDDTAKHKVKNIVVKVEPDIDEKAIARTAAKIERFQKEEVKVPELGKESNESSIAMQQTFERALTIARVAKEKMALIFDGNPIDTGRLLSNVDRDIKDFQRKVVKAYDFYKRYIDQIENEMYASGATPDTAGQIIELAGSDQNIDEILQKIDEYKKKIESAENALDKQTKKWEKLNDAIEKATTPGSNGNRPVDNKKLNELDKAKAKMDKLANELDSLRNSRVDINVDLGNLSQESLVVARDLQKIKKIGSEISQMKMFSAGIDSQVKFTRNTSVLQKKLDDINDNFSDSRLETYIKEITTARASLQKLKGSAEYLGQDVGDAFTSTINSELGRLDKNIAAITGKLAKRTVAIYNKKHYKQEFPSVQISEKTDFTKNVTATNAFSEEMIRLNQLMSEYREISRQIPSINSILNKDGTFNVEAVDSYAKKVKEAEAIYKKFVNEVNKSEKTFRDVGVSIDRKAISDELSNKTQRVDFAGSLSKSLGKADASMESFVANMARVQTVFNEALTAMTDKSRSFESVSSSVNSATNYLGSVYNELNNEAVNLRALLDRSNKMLGHGSQVSGSISKKVATVEDDAKKVGLMRTALFETTQLGISLDSLTSRWDVFTDDLSKDVSLRSINGVLDQFFALERESANVEEKTKHLRTALKDVLDNGGQYQGFLGPEYIGGHPNSQEEWATNALGLLEYLNGVETASNRTMSAIDSVGKHLSKSFSFASEEIGDIIARTTNVKVKPIDINFSVRKNTPRSGDESKEIERLLEAYRGVSVAGGRAISGIESVSAIIAKMGSIADMSEDDLRALSNEINASTYSSRNAISSIDALISQFRNLAANSKDTRRSFIAEEQSIEQIVSQLSTLKKAITENSGSHQSLKKRIDFQSSALQQLTGDTDQYAIQLVSAIRQNSIFALSFGAMFGSVQMMREALNSFIELQYESARAVAVSRDVMKTNSELAQQFSGELRQASLSLGVSLTDGANILKEFGSAGLEAKESIAALDSTLKAIIATEGSAVDFTRTVAGIYSVLGDSIDQAATKIGRLDVINDVMVRAFRESQLELGELVQGFRFSSAAANVVGVDFMELTALLELLNNNLIKSGQAGRSLQTTFSQIAKKTSAFENAFDIDIDTTGGLDFVKIIHQVSEQMSKGALSAEDVSEVFRLLGLEGARSFLVLTQQVEEFDRLLLDLKDNAEGSADATARIKIDTVKGQLDRLKQATLELFRVMISAVMGENFQHLQKSIELAYNAVRNITQFFETSFGKFIVIATTAVFGLSTAILGVTVAYKAFGIAASLGIAKFKSLTIWSEALTVAQRAAATATNMLARAQVAQAAAAQTSAVAIQASVAANASVMTSIVAKAGTAMALLGKGVVSALKFMFTTPWGIAILSVLAVAGVAFGVFQGKATKARKELEHLNDQLADMSSSRIELNETITAYDRLGDKLAEVASQARLANADTSAYGEEIRNVLERYGAGTDVSTNNLGLSNDDLAARIELIREEVRLQEEAARIERELAEVERERLQEQFRNTFRETGYEFGGRHASQVQDLSVWERMGRFLRGTTDLEHVIDRANENYNAFMENVESRGQMLRDSGIERTIIDIANAAREAGADEVEVRRLAAEELAKYGIDLEHAIELQEQLGTSEGSRELMMALERANRSAGDRRHFMRENYNDLAAVSSGILVVLAQEDEGIQHLTMSFSGYNRQFQHMVETMNKMLELPTLRSNNVDYFVGQMRIIQDELENSGDAIHAYRDTIENIFSSISIGEVSSRVGVNFISPDVNLDDTTQQELENQIFQYYHSINTSLNDVGNITSSLFNIDNDVISQAIREYYEAPIEEAIGARDVLESKLSEAITIRPGVNLEEDGLRDAFENISDNFVQNIISRTTRTFEDWNSITESSISEDVMNRVQEMYDSLNTSLSGVSSGASLEIPFELPIDIAGINDILRTIRKVKQEYARIRRDSAAVGSNAESLGEAFEHASMSSVDLARELANAYDSSSTLLENVRAFVDVINDARGMNTELDWSVTGSAIADIFQNRDIAQRMRELSDQFGTSLSSALSSGLNVGQISGGIYEMFGLGSVDGTMLRNFADQLNAELSANGGITVPLSFGEDDSIEEMSDKITQFISDNLSTAEGIEAIAIAYARASEAGSEDTQNFLSTTGETLNNMNRMVMAAHQIYAQYESIRQVASEIAVASLNSLTNLRDQNSILTEQLRLMDSIRSSEFRRIQMQQLAGKIAVLEAISGAPGETGNDQTAAQQQLETLRQELNLLLEEERQYQALDQQKRQTALQIRSEVTNARNALHASIVSMARTFNATLGSFHELGFAIQQNAEDLRTTLRGLADAQSNNTEQFSAVIEYLSLQQETLAQLRDRTIEIIDLRQKEFETMLRIQTFDSERVGAALDLRDAARQVMGIEARIRQYTAAGMHDADVLVDLQVELRDAQLAQNNALRESIRLDAERFNNLAAVRDSYESVASAVGQSASGISTTLMDAFSVRLEASPFFQSLQLAKDFGIELGNNIPENLGERILRHVREMPEAFVAARGEFADLVSQYVRFLEIQEEYSERARELSIRQSQSRAMAAERLFDIGDYSGAIENTNAAIEALDSIRDVAPEAYLDLFGELIDQMNRYSAEAEQFMYAEDRVVLGATDGIRAPVNVFDDLRTALDNGMLSFEGYEEQINSIYDQTSAFMNAMNDFSVQILETFNNSDENIQAFRDSLTNVNTEIRTGVEELVEYLQVLTNIRDVAGAIERQNLSVRQGGSSTLGILGHQLGGRIPYADGGRVSGVGVSDTVPAILTPGEFVIPKSVVARMTSSQLERLRAGDFIGFMRSMRMLAGFQNGGSVGGGTVTSSSSDPNATIDLRSAFDNFSSYLRTMLSLISGFKPEIESIESNTGDINNNTEGKDGRPIPEGFVALPGSERVSMGQSYGSIAAQVETEAANNRSLLESLNDHYEKTNTAFDLYLQELDTILGDFSLSFGKRIQAAFEKGFLESIGSNIRHMLDTFVKFASTVPSLLDTAFDIASQSTGDAAKAAGDLAASTTEDLEKALRRNEISYYEYLNRLEDAMNEAPNLGDAIDPSAASSTYDDLFNSILEKWMSTMDSMRSTARGEAESIAGIINDTLEQSFRQLFGNMIARAHGFGTRVSEGNAADGGKEQPSELLPKIEKFGDDISDSIESVTRSIKNGGPIIREALSDAARGIAQAFGSASDRISDNAVDMSSQLTSIAVDAARQAVYRTSGRSVEGEPKESQTGTWAFARLLGGIQNAFEAALSGASSFGYVREDPNSVTPKSPTFKDIWTSLREALSRENSNGEEKKRDFGSAAKYVYDLVSLALDKFGTSISNITDKISSYISKIFNKIKDGVSNFIDKIKDSPVFQGITKFASGITKKLGIDKLMKGIASVAPTILQGFTKVYAGVAGLIGKFAAASPEQMAAFIQTIDNIPDIISKIANNIAENAPVLIDKIIAAIPKIVDALVEALPKVVKAITDKLPDLIVALTRGAGKLIKALIEQLPTLVNGLLDALVAFLPELGTLVADVALAIAKAIGPVISGIIEHLPDIIEGLMEGIVNIIENLPEILISLVGSISEAIGSLVVNLPEILWSLFKAFSIELPIAIGKAILELFERIWAGIKEFFADLFGGVRDAASSVGDWFSGAADTVASIFHQGGVVGSTGFDTAKEAIEKGLSADEVLAVLQNGEGVLTRQGLAALGGEDALNKLNAGISLSEFKNFTPVMRTPAPILSSMTRSNEYGSLVKGNTSTNYSPSTNMSVSAPITINITINSDKITEQDASNLAKQISDAATKNIIDSLARRDNFKLNAAMSNYSKR